MKEILTANEAAREIGCTSQKGRERMKRGMWDLLKLTPIQAASIVLGRTLTSKEIKEFIVM